jgi:hypothetical protein
MSSIIFVCALMVLGSQKRDNGDLLTTFPDLLDRLDKPYLLIHTLFAAAAPATLPMMRMMTRMDAKVLILVIQVPTALDLMTMTMALNPCLIPMAQTVTTMGLTPTVL